MQAPSKPSARTAVTFPLQTNPLGRYSFTERARQVVVLAQDEARTLNHNYIGTEHILLGLVRENEGVPPASCSTSTPTPRRSATR